MTLDFGDRTSMPLLCTAAEVYIVQSSISYYVLLPIGGSIAILLRFHYAKIR